MTEKDYLAMKNNAVVTPSVEADALADISSQVLKEIIVPAIEKEVNQGKSFAPLRQVYSGMLLATWYKRALKDSILGKLYADQGKVKGVDQDPKANQEIYTKYVEAFQKGVFNIIQEDVDRYSQETIPRKYFSGGAEHWDYAAISTGTRADDTAAVERDASMLDMAEAKVETDEAEESHKDKIYRLAKQFATSLYNNGKIEFTSDGQPTMYDVITRVKEELTASLRRNFPGDKSVLEEIDGIMEQLEVGKVEKNKGQFGRDSQSVQIRVLPSTGRRVSFGEKKMYSVDGTRENSWLHLGWFSENELRTQDLLANIDRTTEGHAALRRFKSAAVAAKALSPEDRELFNTHGLLNSSGKLDEVASIFVKGIFHENLPSGDAVVKALPYKVETLKMPNRMDSYEPKDPIDRKLVSLPDGSIVRFGVLRAVQSDLLDLWNNGWNFEVLKLAKNVIQGVEPVRSDRFWDIWRSIKIVQEGEISEEIRNIIKNVVIVDSKAEVGFGESRVGFPSTKSVDASQEKGAVKLTPRDYKLLDISGKGLINVLSRQANAEGISSLNLNSQWIERVLREHFQGSNGLEFIISENFKGEDPQARVDLYVRKLTAYFAAQEQFVRNQFEMARRSGEFYENIELPGFAQAMSDGAQETEVPRRLFVRAVGADFLNRSVAEIAGELSQVIQNVPKPDSWVGKQARAKELRILSSRIQQMWAEMRQARGAVMLVSPFDYTNRRTESYEAYRVLANRVRSMLTQSRLGLAFPQMAPGEDDLMRLMQFLADTVSKQRAIGGEAAKERYDQTIRAIQRETNRLRDNRSGDIQTAIDNIVRVGSREAKVFRALLPIFEQEINPGESPIYQLRSTLSIADLMSNPIVMDLIRGQGRIRSLFLSLLFTPQELAEQALERIEGIATEENSFTKGGIDFAQSNLDLQIKRDGNGMVLPISDQNLDNIRIDGLVPVILNIRPAVGTPMLSLVASPEATAV